MLFVKAECTAVGDFSDFQLQQLRLYFLIVLFCCFSFHVLEKPQFLWLNLSDRQTEVAWNVFCPGLFVLSGPKSYDHQVLMSAAMSFVHHKELGCGPPMHDLCVWEEFVNCLILSRCWGYISMVSLRIHQHEVRGLYFTPTLTQFHQKFYDVSSLL